MIVVHLSTDSLVPACKRSPALEIVVEYREEFSGEWLPSRYESRTCSCTQQHVLRACVCQSPRYTWDVISTTEACPRLCANPKIPVLTHPNLMVLDCSLHPTLQLYHTLQEAFGPVANHNKQHKDAAIVAGSGCDLA
eukprot:2783380-Amphidinium_carterae.1